MRRYFICPLTLAFIPLLGSAATVDFDSFPSSSLYSGTPPANTILTDELRHLGIIFGETGVSVGVAVVSNPPHYVSAPNAVAGLNAATEIPEFHSGDIHFSFVLPGTTIPGVTDFVSFYIGDECCDLDSFQIRAFDLNNLLIRTEVTSALAFTQVILNQPSIHRIEIDKIDSSVSGYVLDNLEFHTPQNVRDSESILLAGFVLMGLFAVENKLKRT